MRGNYYGSRRRAFLCLAVVLAFVAPVRSFHVRIATASSRCIRACRTQTALKMPGGLRPKHKFPVLCQAEPPAGGSCKDSRTRGSTLQLGRSAASAAILVGLSAPFSALAADGSGAQSSLVQGMIAGAVAGAAVDLVLYPIDTIKTRLQTESMQELTLESVPALYSGLLGSLAGHVPSSALFFAIYETSKVYWLEPMFGQGAVAAQLLASALGNLGASTIRVPTEVVKTRLQSGGEESLSRCCQNILSQVHIFCRLCHMVAGGDCAWFILALGGFVLPTHHLTKTLAGRTERVFQGLHCVPGSRPTVRRHRLLLTLTIRVVC